MVNVGESIALIITNLAIIPIWFITIYFGDLVSFTLAMLMFIISTFYHLCLAEIFCIAPLRIMQASDHLMVYALVLWIYLLIMYTKLDIQISIFLVVLFSLIVMIPLLLETILVELIILLFIFSTAFVQFFLFKMKLKAFNLLFALIVAFVFASAIAVYFFAGDVKSTSYKIIHPLWHILAMLGLIPLFFLIYGVSINDIINKFKIK